MVELLIVLVILAILSAIALPNLRSGMRREQLSSHKPWHRSAGWSVRAIKLSKRWSHAKSILRPLIQCGFS